MRRQMSWKQYRTMDLCFFTALLCVGEVLCCLAARIWFPGEPYALSLTPAVTAIVLVRWGLWAAVPAVAGAAAFCFASGASAVQYLIYGAGNLAALSMMVFVAKGQWQRLRQSVLRAMCYGLLTALCMQLGRAAIALCMGSTPAVCADFITTDILSTLFAVLIVWIARRLDGMLEDQKHYLVRVQKEEQDKGA